MADAAGDVFGVNVIYFFFKLFFVSKKKNPPFLKKEKAVELKNCQNTVSLIRRMNTLMSATPPHQWILFW